MKNKCYWWPFAKSEFEPYFKKDAYGRNVYYPWGGAGDNFSINGEQMKILKMSYYLPFLIFLISAYFLLSKYSNISIFSVVIISCNLGLMAWMLFLSLYRKTLAPSEMQQSMVCMESKQPKLLKDLFIALVFQIFFFAMGIFVKPKDPIIIELGVSVVLIYLFLIWFVWRRRGYIFQKKPQSKQS